MDIEPPIFRPVKGRKKKKRKVANSTSKPQSPGKKGLGVNKLTLINKVKF